ncbi:hypothetical protein EVAR_53324_1 [Eumeta japonica]|uniref:Uncharacterized protein n=1 Tax=Eumeta variegata TaxID=151549 RepID=A0A4C1X7Z5_EUMVA|nr:hypothetical protein EVAR_53324_1 [Eumeta japonica]
MEISIPFSFSVPALNFDPVIASRSDSGHVLNSKFDPTLDFDLGLILVFDADLGFQFHPLPCLHFDSAISHDSDLDEDLENASSIETKFGLRGDRIAFNG